jgi:hypothetical protein
MLQYKNVQCLWSCCLQLRRWVMNIKFVIDVVEITRINEVVADSYTLCSVWLVFVPNAIKIL